MTISLKTTLIHSVSTVNGVQRVSFGVSVNGIHVMTWDKTLDSSPDAPVFTGRAEFRSGEFHVFQSNGWLPQVIDGILTTATEIPFGLFKTATDDAIRDMFRDADQLTLVRRSDGYDVNLGDTTVLNWWLMEYGQPFYCFDDRRMAQSAAFIKAGGATDHTYDEDDTVDNSGVFMMSGTPTSSAFMAWNDGDSDGDQWDGDEIENITPHAYRALINGWVK